MAVFSAILCPAETSCTKTAVSATTSSAEVALGPNFIFAIVADVDINLKFGVPGLGAATASDFYIPAKTVLTFDSGRQFTSVRFFNPTAGAGNVYIQPLSKF